MVQPTAQPDGSAAPTKEEEQPELLKFTLSIISPSSEVPNPLVFPQLLATTTVKDLKAKIQDVIPSKPVEEHQRLIHRGRLLAREMETMEDIFGKDTLTRPEPQTLHLVLPATVTAMPVPPSTSTPSTPLAGPPNRVATPHPRPQSTPAQPNNAIPHQHHLPGIQHIQQHQLLHQADHLQNMMTQRLNQLHQETLRLQQEMTNIEQRTRFLAANAGGVINNNTVPTPFTPPQTGHAQPPAIPITVQQLIAQQQFNRAAEGRQGAQDPLFNFNSPSPQRPLPGSFRPNRTTITTREGVGPNGERWQVTVNETTSTVPIVQHANIHNLHGPAQPVNNPALETLQSIIRNADRVLAAQNPTNNAGGPSTANYTATEVGSSVPQTQQQNVPSDSSAGVATPATGSSSPSSSILLNQPPNRNPAEAVASINTPINDVNPVVYLLSSPQGPRALLLSNAETYFSPRQPRRRRHDSPAAVQGHAQEHLNQARLGLPHLRRGARGIPNAQNGGNPVAPQAHGNPAAGALGAQIGPIIWLIVRLAGFVWFFTAGNHSWWRFLTVSALALTVFIINTGVLNSIAEQLWGPIRRHVEALIPLAGPEAARIPAANAAIPQQPGPPPPVENQPAPRRRRGELDENEFAARLIEQRRQANPGWIMTQMRRAEHAALLFLASLVPGVGERHIAAREAEAAEAEAERQRRIEAAAAAENQDTADSENQETTANPEQAPGDAPSGVENQEDEPQNPEPANVPPPLIDI